MYGCCVTQMRMQQHGKFSRHSDDGTIAGLLASA
jgi:hypothetical protein